MELSLTTTLVILALTSGMFAFAGWRNRQPVNLLKIRMINYGVVQLVCVFVILLIGAHLVTLIAGHPLTGQGQSTP